MAFQISPGVNVSEVDLTTVVPSVSTTAGAFVGDFQWGPADKRTLVTTESELVSVFGQPSANTSAASGVANTGVSFFSAANFLAYGNNLQVVRAVGSSTINATTGNTAILIDNEDSYDNGFTANSFHGTFGARYAGALGNSLKVSLSGRNRFVLMVIPLRVLLTLMVILVVLTQKTSVLLLMASVSPVLVIAILTVLLLAG